MSLPREFIVLLGTAGCAFALIFSGGISGPQTFDLSAPLRFAVLVSAEATAADDTATLALRQEARAALAGLKSAAVAATARDNSARTDAAMPLTTY
jgi:hypothetical protein